MQQITATLSVVFSLAMSCAVEAPDQEPATSGAPELQIVSSLSELKWGPAPALVPERSAGRHTRRRPVQVRQCLNKH